MLHAVMDFITNSAYRRPVCMENNSNVRIECTDISGLQRLTLIKLFRSKLTFMVELNKIQSFLLQK